MVGFSDLAGKVALVTGANTGIGQGIALARSVLVEHDLASGRLVRVGDASTASGRAYFAVCSPAARARPEVQRFLEWLVAASRRTVQPRVSLAAVR